MVEVIIVDYDKSEGRAGTLAKVVKEVETVKVKEVISSWDSDSDLILKLNIQSGSPSVTWLLAHDRDISAAAVEKEVKKLFGERVLRYSGGANTTVLKMNNGDEYSKYDWGSFFEQGKLEPGNPPVWILTKSVLLELIENFAPLSLLNEDEDKLAFVRVIAKWREDKKKQNEKWKVWKSKINFFIKHAKIEMHNDQESIKWCEWVVAWLEGESEFITDGIVPVRLVRRYL